MSNFLRSRHIAAIDIGTTKICVLIASINQQGKIEVIGIGQHPSYGLKKGVIVNIGLTVDSIKQAVKEAEAEAGVKIYQAAVGISGGHIQSFNSTGVVAIKDRDVTQEDIDRVVEASKIIPIPADREILHVIPQYFRVDGQELVQDSLGMYGVRLEAQVHIVTGAVASAQNIIKSCELAGLLVSDIVLEQIASAEAVLTPTERELGVGILDIGGGTSDFAIYKDGRIRHSKVIPIAGNHFTNDLAIGLGIPIKVAEELKRSYGFVIEDRYLDYQTDQLEVSLGYEGGTKEVDLYTLFEILNPRAVEIYELLHEEIMRYHLKGLMPSGLVLTGGGALLNGNRDLAQKMFEIPVRIGVPHSLHPQGDRVPDVLKSPIYSTGYGLLLYAAQAAQRPTSTAEETALVSRVFKKMKSWIHDFL